MDQCAHLVAERLAGGVVVTSWREIAGVLGDGQIPVLAPSGWLQEADPLPHSWDVTGDSIAAWVAGRVGARHLVLVKPPGVGIHSSDRTGSRVLDRPAQHAAVAGFVDAYFLRALPRGVTWTIVPADQMEALPPAFDGP